MSQYLLRWQQWAASHNQALRILRHVLIWITVWLLTTATVVLLVRDNQLINSVVTVLIATSTLVYYYFLGYYVLPKFLHPTRPIWLIGSLILTYWISYLVNRAVFLELQPYSISATSYLSRVSGLVEKAGWLGCFTSIKLALWNYVLGFYLVTLLLIVKTVTDITAYRNQAIRLQSDELRLERDKLTLERNHLALELNFLKMQISPHFLFNTLNSIYSRVVDADEQAAKQVLRLAELMRYNLYEASAERIALEHELTYISDYLQLEQSRHAQWMLVTLEADDNVTRYQIAPLLLSTFVENAFKHGVRSGRTSYVQVNARMEGDTLVFSVRNSLQQKTTPSDRKSGGMGLVNVTKRLDLLYPNRHDLETGAAVNQYVVTLRLQLEPLAKQSL
ncbi:hypothetical protein GCM10028807_00370 [Spirosoma daeguense]